MLEAVFISIILWDAETGEVPMMELQGIADTVETCELAIEKVKQQFIFEPVIVDGTCTVTPIMTKEDFITPEMQEKADASGLN